MSQLNDGIEQKEAIDHHIDRAAELLSAFDDIDEQSEDQAIALAAAHAALAAAIAQREMLRLMASSNRP